MSWNQTSAAEAQRVALNICGRYGKNCRLVSRFEWGLTAELQPPDIETRMAILRKKAQALHVQLAQEILEFLAQRVRSNVRRLEGALMRVASFVSLSGREISRETVEQLLRDILQEEAKKRDHRVLGKQLKLFTISQQAG